MQAHGGGHGPLNGAAAPLPGVFPAVSIGGLVPKKEESLRWEYLCIAKGTGGMAICQPLHTDNFI